MGAGVIGISRIAHATGTGPDAATVTATGETLTAADFRARSPRGSLVERTVYGALRGP